MIEIGIIALKLSLCLAAGSVLFGPRRHVGATSGAVFLFGNLVMFTGLVVGSVHCASDTDTMVRQFGAVGAGIGIGVGLFFLSSPWVQTSLFICGFVPSAFGCELRDYVLDRISPVRAAAKQSARSCSIWKTLFGIALATAVAMWTFRSITNALKHWAGYDHL